MNTLKWWHELKKIHTTKYQMGVVFYAFATLGGVIVAVVVEFIFELFEMIARAWQPRLVT